MKISFKCDIKYNPYTIEEVQEWDGSITKDMTNIGDGLKYSGAKSKEKDVYHMYMDCEKARELKLNPIPSNRVLDDWQNLIDRAINVGVQFERDKKINDILDEDKFYI